MQETPYTSPEAAPKWKGRVAWFLSGQTVSIFGSALVQFAIIWHITLVTQSGTMLTLSTICGFVPQIVLSIFAGVWADRYNRKTLIVLGDSLTALSTLAVALLFLFGYNRIWLLFAVSAVRAVGSGIQGPAVSALLPQLVPQSALPRVNGIHSTLQSLSTLLAPAASGALLSLAGLESVFFVDVSTALVGISILLAIQIPRQKRAQTVQQNYFADFRCGLRYVAGHRLVRTLLVYYAIFMFAIVPTAFLTPLMIARNFGDEVWRLTANEMSFGIGAFVGGLLISVWGGFRNRMVSFSLSMMAFGVTSFFLGFTTHFTLFLALIGISGLFLPLFNTPSVTLLQEKVEGDMLGRVFGLVQTIATCTMPLGMAIFGPLADVSSVEILLVITGIVMVVLGLHLLRSDLRGEAVAPQAPEAENS